MIPESLADLAAEEQLLGCLLNGVPAADRPELVALLPDPSPFTAPERRAVYAAWLALDAAAVAEVPVFAFRTQCQAHGTWGSLPNGVAYLTYLADCATVGSGSLHYARRVVDLWHRRELWHAADATHQHLTDLSTPLHDLLPAILSGYSALGAPVARGGPNRAGVGLYDALGEIERQGASVLDHGAVPTGLTDLDAHLGGYAPGRLIVVAARPNQGKSAFVTATALAAAQHGPVWFWSLEMSQSEILQRLLSTVSGVNLRPRSGARYLDSDFPKLHAAAGQLHDLPLTIDDSSSTVPQLRAHLAALPAPERPALVIVDYLQLIESPKGQGYERRDLEVAALTRQLKRNVAREFGVPVLACAQLKRLQEAETPREPRLDDLRESGAIEQDADQVVMLHYTGAEDGISFQASEGRKAGWGDANRTQLLIRKNRHGPRGTVNAFYHRSTHRWGDWSPR